MAKDEARGLTRRELFGIAVGCLAVAYARPAKADLFGGDITVLLAQLEQQLTLVSNAISTVQRVTETAQRAAKMVDQGGQMLRMATGQGGLQGFLTGLKGIVDTGRGAVGNLQTMNIRGGMWKDKITANHGSLSFQDGMSLTNEAMQMDARFLRDVSNMSKSFAQVMSPFDALESAADAVREASSVTGVVGQVQLLGREMFQLTGIAAQMTMGMGMMGNMQVNELGREAAEREGSRAAAKQMYGLYGRPQEAEAVDVRLTDE
jgi:hypothetical protein